MQGAWHSSELSSYTCFFSIVLVNQNYGLKSRLGRRSRDRMVVGFTTTYAISFMIPPKGGVLDTTLCDKVCQ